MSRAKKSKNRRSLEPATSASQDLNEIGRLRALGPLHIEYLFSMSANHSAFPKELLAPLGGSGFPFQTAVAAAMRSVSQFEVKEEVAWQDSDGAHRFLDIVAAGEHVWICVECKAMRSDTLVFLLPHRKGSQETADISGVFLARVQDSTRRPVVTYGVSQMQPLTPESMYCVVLGKTSSESRLIEREVQPLVRGTEELAKDSCREFRPVNDRPQRVALIPILVTAARLFAAEYDPSHVSLNDAVYQAHEEHIRPVRFMRFTKEFTSHGREKTRLRTVFVTQAADLEDLVTMLSRMFVEPDAENSVRLFDSISGDLGRRS